MSADCDEMRLLIQADLDGELRPAEAARVAAHLAHCADCAAIQAELAGLSGRMADEVPSYPASDAFRAALVARLAAEAPSLVSRPARRPRPFLLGASFSVGAALAASMMFLLMPMSGAQWPDEIVSSHIRALQPGHLMDVVSTDQHTVKPWFDGRLPFAPPVKDLAAIGFPLAGGRLDYLAGRTAAAMIYHRGQHVIDLYAFDGTDLPAGLPTGSRDGYNFERWVQGGMSFWAVSDLNAQELADFAREWRKL